MTGPRRTTVAVLAAATAAGLLTAAGCGGGAPRTAPALVVPEEPAPEYDLLLAFEDRAAPVGAVIPAVANAGLSGTRSRVVTAAGGRIVRAEGPEGGHAIRFPAHSAEGPTAAAVLLVQADGDDFLAPGRRDFTIGLDFMLDALSAGSETDDGDNLMQRGLFADSEQYKLQVDAGVLSCRINGRAGEALAKSPHVVRPERWHRVSCTRVGDRVRLSVQEAGPRGWGTPEVVEVEAATGALWFRDVLAPLSVGGKVTPEGAVVTSSTDQFNGVIDNLHYGLVD